MTTETLATITLDAYVAAVAAVLRAAGPGVEIDLPSASPWRYTIELCAPSPVESSGATIAERPVTVEVAAYGPVDHNGYLDPAVRTASLVLGEQAGPMWGVPDGKTRNRAQAHKGHTLSEAVAEALEALRGAAADAIALANARAMAIAAEDARYAEALAR